MRLRADEGDLWFVGDTSFRAEDVNPEAPTTGIHTDVRETRRLQAWLAARSAPRAFLPSHDEAVPATLATVRGGQPLRATPDRRLASKCAPPASVDERW